MMQSLGLESSAHIIAENVASAFERACADPDFDDFSRETLVARLLRELLSVMPTQCSNTLTAACNHALDNTAGVMGFSGPRVEAVDPDDGSVSMRRG